MKKKIKITVSKEYGICELKKIFLQEVELKYTKYLENSYKNIIKQEVEHE